MSISPTLRGIPAILAALLIVGPAHAQKQACFQEVASPPWSGTDVGALRVSSSRPAVNGGFELCSLSAGFGATEDELRFLFQPVRADFEVVGILNSIEGNGQGGLMARLDARTENYPYAAIWVGMSAAGGPVLRSTARLEPGEKAGPVNGSTIPVELPIYLRLSRSGNEIVTSYSSDGKNFKEQLRLDIGKTSLANFFLSAGMVQASVDLQTPGSALFNRPAIRMEERGLPPRIDSASPPNGPLEGGVEVVIRGSGFSLPGAGPPSVTLAGIPASILDASDEKLVVLAGPSPEARAGDVVVETAGGRASLEGAFAYLGHTFIRSDVDGNGKLEITDPVSLLNFLFLGSRGPQCFAAADFDASGMLDISDAVRGLQFLFLGDAPPPAPFPRPGIGNLAEPPCGLPASPRILEISPRSFGEGDLVAITGEGFSPIPEVNRILFGGAPAEILQAGERHLLVRAVNLTRSGLAEAALASDLTAVLFPDLSRCKTGSCAPPSISLVTLYREFPLQLQPAKYIPVASARPEVNRPVQIRLPIDPANWDPSLTYDVGLNLLLPAVQGVSRGSLISHFQFRHYYPEVGYGEWLEALAAQIDRSLNGGGAPIEFTVRSDPKGNQILFDLRSDLVKSLTSEYLASLIEILLRPPHRACGPFDPVENRREYGWCRFAELTEECGGFPKWEFFIPKQLVLQASGAIFPLPSPSSFSPGQKDSMYNRDAYCHVRSNQLYKGCILDGLAASGKSQIPHFPRSATVVKTRWESESDLLAAGKDPSKHYSYVKGGVRWCLTLFHFTDKSVDNWFWADFYVPAPYGRGGCGASGGDRPSSITGVWSNYEMCTNLEATEAGNVCGNGVIGIECVQNCISCHQNSSWSSGGKTMKLDFLFGLGSAIPASSLPCP